MKEGSDIRLTPLMHETTKYNAKQKQEDFL